MEGGKGDGLPNTLENEGQRNLNLPKALSVTLRHKRWF